MMGQVCWSAFVFVVCFTVIGATDVNDHNAATKNMKIHPPKCEHLCRELNVENGCQLAPSDSVAVREEVIVVTNGSSDIEAWEWDTITMVISEYYDGLIKTGMTACVAHSKGKRFGLRERVPGSEDINEVLIDDITSVKKQFFDKVMEYRSVLNADHIVFDLVDFAQQLENILEPNKTLAISNMHKILFNVYDHMLATNAKKIFCIVPWQPPCKERDCEHVKILLGNCQVLVLSPDSYTPSAPESGQCQARATIPISMFLYGVDRYIALGAQSNVQQSIVAGIPWHGYTYNCSLDISNDKCIVNRTKGEKCFDSSNRKRSSLGDIHGLSLSEDRIKMDEISKGIYYNVEKTRQQVWFENFTTLALKYQLVQDLNLRGLSIWYGEDIMLGLSDNNNKFALQSWNFLTHRVLHKATSAHIETNHYYADTVAGIGVGCLILGTVLGVIFTCIGMRRRQWNQLNRPFKLDEVDDGFRDDEGL